MKRLGILVIVALLPELVGLLFFNVHSIHIFIALGVSSVIIFVLGYLVLVIVQLFQLFWESLEVDSDTFNSSVVHRDFPELLEPEHLPLTTPKEGYVRLN